MNQGEVEGRELGASWLKWSRQNMAVVRDIDLAKLCATIDYEGRKILLQIDPLELVKSDSWLVTFGRSLGARTSRQATYVALEEYLLEALDQIDNDTSSIYLRARRDGSPFQWDSTEHTAPSDDGAERSWWTRPPNAD